MARISQNEKVYQYMKQNGKISSMDAINKLRITRLSARISDLRDSGINIKSTTVYKKHKDGTPYHYAEYTIED